MFENHTIAKTIDEALHLVALDEKRKAFMPTLMNKEERVTEIWFSGAHSNVGGGNRRDGLSDVTLEFMVSELGRRGLGLNIVHPGDILYGSLLPPEAEFKIDYSDVMMDPKFWGASHQQQRIFTGWLTLEDREVRINIDDRSSDALPLLHHSITERVHGDDDYRPESLVGLSHRMLMPDGGIEAYDGLMAHRAQGALPVTVLEPGESKAVKVYARKKYNASGVLMLHGATYVFEFNENQTWYDASIEATVGGWSVDEEDIGSVKALGIKAARRFRRIPDARWFELVAAVGQSDDELLQVTQYSDEAYPYLAAKSGEFCPFANDLDSRYGNNLGYVDVTIKRVA